mmetsp:Transcript_45789/g.88083  ORF Transcript_45789/g.88083 Transcript_45789/m.88083 type:complete len:344 (+) Transcript_45789:998-2029(+)
MGRASSSGYASKSSTAFISDASGSSVHNIGRGGAPGTKCTHTCPDTSGLSCTSIRPRRGNSTSPCPSSLSRCARQHARDHSKTSVPPTASVRRPSRCSAPTPVPAPACCAQSAGAAVVPSLGVGSAPLPSSQACTKKSASSPTVTGMPIGIFSRSCMGSPNPQPSSREVHLLTEGALSSAASSGGGAVAVDDEDAAGSNSQTSASTSLGSDGSTEPRHGGGGNSVDAPLPSLRNCAVPPSAVVRGGWRCGPRCCSPSTALRTVCTGSSASTANSLERSGRASRTWRFVKIRCSASLASLSSSVLPLISRMNFPRRQLLCCTWKLPCRQFRCHLSPPAITANAA